MISMEIQVKLDNVSNQDVVKLLEDHLSAMQAHTPPESVHALDLSAYQSPSLKLWTAWTDNRLMGCGALKDLGSLNGERLGEIKSMRTRAEFLRMGVGDAVLATIIAYARKSGIQRLSLETGVTDHFQAANKFYTRKGFVKTEPFGDYVNDPHSVFYTLDLKN